MIKYDSKEGCAILKGDGITLLSELTQIMRILYKNGILDEDNIDTIVRLTKLSEDTIREEAVDILKHIIFKACESDKENEDVLKKIFGDILEGEES